ncbi:MAG: ABC transporter ATP-binding protein [Bradyrhizobium sp.]
MQVQIERVSKKFGGLKALDSVSLIAKSGEVTALIGPNGAGKSTLINCLTGIFGIDSGSIVINDREFNRIYPHQLIEIGIARTFQNIRVWDHLSVAEHIVLARQSYHRSGRAKKGPSDRDIRAYAIKILSRLGLGSKADRRPDQLSYGERRRLEIARGLATQPDVLLLDEPAAGFTLSEQSNLADLILEIAAEAIAVILVEHHMDLVAKVSAKVVVLNFGSVIVTGTPAEIRTHPEVISAYLGVSA